MFAKVLKSVCILLHIIYNNKHICSAAHQGKLKKDVKINLNQGWVLIIETLIFYVFHNFAFLLEQ